MLTSLYHIKSAQLRGNWLYPLNTLARLHPDLYAKERAKYEGREWVTELRIPLLDCYWNDVLHFCPLHPKLIQQSIARFSPRYSRPLDFFEIPIDEFRGLPAVCFELGADKPWGPEVDLRSCFTPLLNIADVQAPTEIPEATQRYYERQCAMGKSPLLFNGIPHILVKAPVSIAKAQTISWI